MSEKKNEKLICPYRINTITVITNTTTKAIQEFAECYKSRCPFFETNDKGCSCIKVSNDRGIKIR